MKLQPVVAGAFYPAQRGELLAALESFGAVEKPEAGEDPVGMLLPHAGYPYSGAVAARGYRRLSSLPETVVLVGPSHYVRFKGVSIFSGESVATPLGDLPVDQEACRFLMESDSRIADIPPAFQREHSVEVHFPLVRHYLPGAKVVPLVMGQGKEDAVQPLAQALLDLWKKKRFLLVASSDLSHYPDYGTAKKADQEFLKALLTGNELEVERTDREILGRGYPEYYCTHCGREPVAVLLKFAKGVGAERKRLLEYRNSGDVTGDRKRVVGYAAVEFYK